MNDDRIISLLESLDASMKALVQAANRRAQASGVASLVADDEDLDGKYGDPEVKFDPRDWNGDSCKGINFSSCPSEYLELLAKSYDYFAKKNQESGALTTSGKPKAVYDRLSAARARGWAQRLRNGWKSPQIADGGDSFEQSDWGENDDPGF